MAGLWVIGLLTLSLLRRVQALPSPTPLPTTFRYPVTLTRIPALSEALHRRDTSPTTTADAMTTLPASVCGYESAILDDTHRVRCASNYDCVLHMPDSNFRGMAGCCAPSNHAECAFKTGCYDNIKLRASPDLLSSSDSLMLSCTSSGRLYCLTSTYASMNIVDYNCGNSPSLATVYTWATSFESGVGLVKATKLSETFDGTLLGSSMSRSSGSHASSHVANATSTTSNTPSGSPSTGSLNGSGSSMSAGMIAGSVVGSVVGVAGIVTAGVVFLLLKKRKRQRVDVVGSGHAQDGYQSGPQDGPSGWGLHQPVNVDGVPTGKVFEAEGNGPAHKSSGVEGSDPANVAHEMDGSRFIAELPAREEGNPTESR